MIGAVVVNYRTPGDLNRFVETWLKWQPYEWKLVIANVAPTERDTAAGLRWARQEKQVTLLEYQDNIGYARACNRATDALTDCDVYAFFNADVSFNSDAVQDCLDALAANPEWGVLGPRQTDSQGRLTHAGMFGTHTKTAPRAWRSRDCGEHHGIEEAITVSGAAFFVTRSCWTHLAACPLYRSTIERLGLDTGPGAFLPTQHYYEETWVSYHAWFHGWKVVYYGPAHVHHEWHQASVVGGEADRQMPISKRLFVAACEAHDIPHD